MRAQGLKRLMVPPLARAPKNATSTDLLNIHGFVSQSSSGLYNILPLGLRVQAKIEQIIRKHLGHIDAQEMAFTSLVDPSIWRKSGRLNKTSHGGFLFSEHQKHLLAPTGEEQVTSLVGDVSYKQLPLSIYQITRKYRNELRPRSGLLRTREFVMKDLYSVDASKDQAMVAYHQIQGAYRAIFDELNVPYLMAEADSGDMGGNYSHEFHYVADIGDDKIVHCKSCNHATNVETLETYKQIDTEGKVQSQADLAEEIHDCPKCHSKSMHVVPGIEVGHTFYLGTRYSEPLGALVTHADGQQSPAEMGSYGIGVTRLIAAIAATMKDEHGLVWPASVAPAHAAVVSNDPAIAQNIAERLASEGISAVYEDRTNQLGHAMRAAREAGWPIVVIAGSKYTETGNIELENRRTGAKALATIDTISAVLQELIAA